MNKSNDTFSPRFTHGYGTVDYWSELTTTYDLATQLLRDAPLEFSTPFVLVVLSMNKDGYFDSLANDASVNLTELLKSKGELPNHELYAETLANLDPAARNTRAVELTARAVATLQSLRTAAYVENFAAIFDYILQKATDRSSGFGGTFVLPAELVSLAVGLVNLDVKASVFNPFTGLASFGLALPEGIQYLGQEIYHATYNLAKLRAVAYGRDLEGRFQLRREDSIECWPQSQKFDLVIASAPFGMKLSPARYPNRVAKAQRASSFVIEEGLDLLASYGQLVTTVALSFLWGEGKERKLRERLINEGLLEKVIAFPGGLLHHTGIPFAMLVLRAPGSASVAPTLIDATAFVERQGRDAKLKVQELLELLGPFGNLRSEKALTTVTTVSRDELASNGYVLTPERYLLSDNGGVELKQLLSPVAGKKIRKRLHGYLTTVKDLRDEQGQEFTIRVPAVDTDILEDYRLPTSTKLVEQSVLLVSMVGRKLKPSYFSNTGSKIPLCIAPQVKAFAVDEGRVHVPYLINELRSQQVHEQLEAYRVGSGIPRIRVDDLLRVRIALPSLEEQRLKMKALADVSKQIADLQREKREIVAGERIERQRRFASLKHTMGRPQQSISSGAKAIRGFLKHLGKEGEAIDRAYAEFFDQERTISDTLQGILDDVNFIGRLMEKGEQGLQMRDYPLSLITLRQIVEQLKQINVQGCKFKLDLRIDDEVKSNSFYLGANVNLHLLKVMVDNLLTNADKHGFEEAHDRNTVRISLSIVKEQLLLEISNNGKPFPKRFEKEQFIQEFSRTQKVVGEGIGGYQVDQIARYFGDSNWTLTSDEEAAFPVTFFFAFPVEQILPAEVPEMQQQLPADIPEVEMEQQLPADIQLDDDFLPKD